MIPMPGFNFLVALGLGLLVGLERERSKGSGPDRRLAGICTFCLAVCWRFGPIYRWPGLFRDRAGQHGDFAGDCPLAPQNKDPGLTTEVGLLCVALLGGLAMSEPLMAAALATAIAVVFASKPWLHPFTKQVLSEREINSALIFAVASLTIWPQLPDRFMGPYSGLNPTISGFWSFCFWA